VQTDGIKMTLKVIALMVLGFLGFYWLTRWAAPAQDQAAIFVGLLLTGFGAALAKFAMEIVVLPLAFLQMLQRVLQGSKPLVINQGKADPLDTLGRVVFVVAFATLAGLVGVGAGVFAGGLGFFLAGLAFAAFGAVLAMLVPAGVLWATEGSNVPMGLTAQQRAEMQAGREAGDPAVLLTDRIVQGVREKLFEDAGGKDRR
jgi:hypothetical protein